MGTIVALIEALKTGLSIWESKEKRKYLDEIIKLEKKYYEEYNKERPDLARLDNLDFRLRLICKSFSAEVGAKNSLDR